MFKAYAFGIRSAYLSAIVLAPLFMAENVVQIIRQGYLSFSGLLWFLLFAGLLVVPSLRAWILWQPMSMQNGFLWPLYQRARRSFLSSQRCCCTRSRCPRARRCWWAEPGPNTSR